MKIEQHPLPEAQTAFAKRISLPWLAQHGRQLLFTLGALFLLTFFLLPFTKRVSKSPSDYLTVDAAFSTWAAQDKHDPALFKQVSDPLVRHPELSAKFGTLIAQKLLSLGQTQLAEEYAKAALKRMRTLLSQYHSAFSENSLLISQGKLKEALSCAYTLKKEMENDASLWGEENRKLKVGRTLYVYNLLRIASLEREAGSKEKEVAALEDLMHHSGRMVSVPYPKTYDPEAFKALSENFKSGEISLFDYIEQRRKELS